MNYRTEIIEHNKITYQVLQDIIALKSVRWPYTYDQQLDWINTNIQPEDIHILIYDSTKLVAYTNLIRISVQINDQEVPCMGIGNVCTLESGKGYGNILLEEIDKSLLNNAWKGMLLCKDNLVNYYEKYGWRIVDNQAIASQNLSINIMVFNINWSIHKLKYEGRNF